MGTLLHDSVGEKNHLVLQYFHHAAADGDFPDCAAGFIINNSILQKAHEWRVIVHNLERTVHAREGGNAYLAFKDLFFRCEYFQIH